MKKIIILTGILLSILLNISIVMAICVDNDGDGFGNPASPDCTYPELDCNDNNGDEYPPVDGMEIIGGPSFKDVIFCPGTYNLPNGVKLLSKSIDLNCNGATLNGSNSSIGIFYNNSQIFIRNCNVMNYEYGIVGYKPSEGCDQPGHNNSMEENHISFNRVGLYLENMFIDWGFNTNIFQSNTDYNLYIYENCTNSWLTMQTYGCEINGKSLDIFTGLHGSSAQEQKIIQKSITQDTTIIIQNLNSGHLDVVESDYVTIKNNNISYDGIRLVNTLNSIVYHNNINGHRFDNKANQWDNGRLSGGNYWENYDEPSEGCYDNDNDGVCDIPFVIDEDSIDNYPFVEPYGWLNYNPPMPENCTDYIDNDLDGYADSEDQDCPFVYALKQGWNLIGYTFPTRNITTALASINGCYGYIFGWYDFWNSFDPLRPLNTLRNMTFGRGYWIKVNCTEVNWTIS